MTIGKKIKKNLQKGRQLLPGRITNIRLDFFFLIITKRGVFPSLTFFRRFEMSELKRPCPFCGSNQVIVTGGLVKFEGFDITYIECNGCGAVTSFRGNEKQKDAVTMYNGIEGDAEQKIAFQKGLNRWKKIA